MTEGAICTEAYDICQLPKLCQMSTFCCWLQLIMVFIIGGTTYEEARAIAELNTQGERNEGWSAGIRFLLGGTGVLNSSSFMNDLMAFMALS